MTSDASPGATERDHGASPQRRRLSLRRMARLMLFFASLPSFIALFGRWSWIADLFTHFRVQWAAAAAILGTLLAVCGDRKAVWVAVAVFAWNVALIAPLYWPLDLSKPIGFRAVSANVLTSNEDAGRLLEYVERANPHVLLLMEVDDAWIERLAPLREQFPYYKEFPRSDNFGMALYSRAPATIEFVELGGVDVPAAVARVEMNGDATKVTVIGVHTVPPIPRANYDDRNRQLAGLASLAAANEGNVVVLGDLNCTSWSSHFADLLRHSGLRDSRKGKGVQATWPVGSPLMRIPIDHALISPGITVANREVGTDIGSDHFPICIDLMLPANGRAAE